MRAMPTRAGLTLFEVVTSMFIFLIAMIGIWQLIAVGTDRARDVHLQAHTSLRCQAKLNELMVGAEPLSGSAGSAYSPLTEEGAPGVPLSWKMEAIENQPAKNLWTVKVWVKADLPGERAVESYLTQIIVDPLKRGSTQDRPDPIPPPTPTEDMPETTTPDPETTPTTPTTPTQPPTGGGNTPPAVTAPPAGGGTTPPAGGGTTPPAGGGKKGG